MTQLAGFIGILLIFGAIIAFHEFGHFICAKLSRMTVYEFSLGFGPALFQRQRGDTLYALRCIPIGGYVRIAGMEKDDLDSPNGYDKKSFGAKFITLIAGVTMNFVLAFLIITFTAMIVGYAKPGNKVIIAGVSPNSPAAKINLQPADQIISINDVPVPNIDEAKALIQHSNGPLKLVILRQDKQYIFHPTPSTVVTAEQKGLIYHMTTIHGLGVGLTMSSGQWERLGPLEAVKDGAFSVARMTVDGVAQLASLVTGNIPVSQLSGPVGIMRISYDTSKNAVNSLAGVSIALQTAAFLSVMVGFFNLLPIPALDGGRLFFLIIEGIRRKPIDREKEERIHAIGMAVLLSLVALVTVNDIVKMIGGKY
jgi:regulator of sigma E protease